MSEREGGVGRAWRERAPRARACTRAARAARVRPVPDLKQGLRPPALTVAARASAPILNPPAATNWYHGTPGINEAALFVPMYHCTSSLSQSIQSGLNAPVYVVRARPSAGRGRSRRGSGR